MTELFVSCKQFVSEDSSLLYFTNFLRSEPRDGYVALNNQVFIERDADVLPHRIDEKMSEDWHPHHMYNNSSDPRYQKYDDDLRWCGENTIGKWAILWGDGHGLVRQWRFEHLHDAVLFKLK